MAWEDTQWRIYYRYWCNSQLAIARFTGWIMISWKYYEFDREMMKQKESDEKEWVAWKRSYLPDLVSYVRSNEVGRN